VLLYPGEKLWNFFSRLASSVKKKGSKIYFTKSEKYKQIKKFFPLKKSCKKKS